MPQTPEGPAEEAASILSKLDSLDLDRYRIVGEYVRFDSGVRSSLTDLRQQVIESVGRPSGRPSCFLLWGAPGSGKSYFVQQLAATLPIRARYEELNLARVDEKELRDRLDTVLRSVDPSLVLIDEVDARPDAAWTLEALLPCLEPSRPLPGPKAFVLAGSGGRAIGEFKDLLRRRPKGSDLLSRIPPGHEYIVPSLAVGDRILVAVSQIVIASQEEGRPVRDVEKLALLFVALQERFGSARQLRALAVDTARRLPLGEDRVRYDYLFRAGDAENKAFWSQVQPWRSALADRYIRILGAAHPPESGAVAKPERARPAEPRPSRPANHVPKIAVLPFTNLSPDPADSFLADGLTEELIGRMSAFEGVRVVARTSAMHYKGSTARITEIAGELGADWIVEGSVRRAGDRLRLSALLVEPGTEASVWSSQFDREFRDLFALETEVASKVAGSIEPVVRPPREGRRSEDFEAYTLFLRGGQAYNLDTEAGYREALELYAQALDRDPNFAEALSSSGRCWSVLALIGAEPWSVIESKALPVVRRALDLRPDLAEAHIALADVHVGLDHLSEAVAEAREAIRLNPNSAEGYLYLGNALAGLGRADEALLALRRAHDLDPVHPLAAALLADVAHLLGHDDEARALLERMLALYPKNAHLARELALLLCDQGKFAEADEVLERVLALVPDDPTLRTGEAILAALRGDRARAESILAAQVGRISPEGLTNSELLVWLALGEFDRAFDALQRLATAHAWPFLIAADPKFAPLRQDPRYRDFCRQVGISERPAG